ncbi:odorant receptor 131-2-like [Sphaeramia orbicularis]|uniref:odorant receptor 131-2-like n=1 Tax=Sphaeramia orbicularis TaxID=375764 RepID=UPI00117C500B|nr:odorant receptor 131-2-like [Sphaeramia orbicularis]
MNLTSGSFESEKHKFAVAVGKNVTVVILGITINYINATMINTFMKHHIFKINPRYVLFIHLVFNDTIQLTISILLFIFSTNSYTLYVPLCCLLILPAIFTTQNTPLNLACMAVECYIAVCMPLHSNHICTVKKTYVVISVIWTLSSLSVLPDLFILLATESQQFLESRVFCHRDNVFRSPYSQKKRDVSHSLFLVVVWLTLFYTYIRILFVARSANTDTKKASNTILLHGFQALLCVMNYVNPMLFRVLVYLFPGEFHYINFILFIINHVLPRFISPVIYGLRDTTFRKYFKKYLLCSNQLEVFKNGMGCVLTASIIMP